MLSQGGPLGNGKCAGRVDKGDGVADGQHGTVWAVGNMESVVPTVQASGCKFESFLLLLAVLPVTFTCSEYCTMTDDVILRSSPAAGRR